MLAEPRDQRRLLDLAAIDTQITQVLHKRRTLPQHAEIVSLAEARKSVTAALVAANTAVSDARYALDKAERDLDPVRQRLERDQERLDAGVVSDPKVVASLVEEVAKLKSWISDLEDVQLDAMQQVDDTTAQQRKAEAIRAEGDTAIRQLMADRDAALGVLEEEAKGLQVEREAVTEGLPADLVAVYDKIRERTGLGAARLERNRCTGCGLEINAVELRRISTLMSNELVRCEECGRILVRVDEATR